MALDLTYRGNPVTIVTGNQTPTVGMMRFNETSNQLEVFDGKAWTIVSPSMLPIGTFPTGPTDEELCARHPGLDELKKQLDEAKAKFEAYKALVKEA